MNTVVFFVVILMAGQTRPLHFEHPVESLAVCLYEAYKFTDNPTHQLLIKGGQLSVGCTVTYSKSEEH